MKTIFSNIEWTDAERQYAQSCGWDIFDIDSTGVLEIQRTEDSKYKSDNDAREAVAMMANHNPIYMKAVAVIAKNIVELALSTEKPETLVERIETITDMYNAYDEKAHQDSCVSILTILRSTV